MNGNGRDLAEHQTDLKDGVHSRSMQIPDLLVLVINTDIVVPLPRGVSPADRLVGWVAERTHVEEECAFCAAELGGDVGFVDVWAVYQGLSVSCGGHGT